MPTTFVSPGVYVREIDLSLYTQQLSDTSLGVVGTASWGPTDEATLITSYSQLAATFGNPPGLSSDGATCAHPALYATQRYLRQGRRAWFVRVASASEAAATVNMETSGATHSFSVAAKYTGTNGNNIRLRVYDGTTTGRKKLVVLLYNPLTGGLQQVETFDNLKKTAEIAGSTTSTDTTSWLYQVNTNSNYIRLTQGTATTGQPQNINPTDLVGTASSLVLAGGDDGVTGIADSDFIGSASSPQTGLHVFDNAEAFTASILAIPGPQPRSAGSPDHNRAGATAAIANALISVAAARKDCIAAIDPPYGLTPTQVVAWSNGDFNLDGTIESAAINSNLAFVTYPWVQQYDPYAATNVYIPPASGFHSEIMAYTDFISEPWFAAAGLVRGKLTNVVKAERTLTQGERDYMYSGGNIINPIATFQGTGLVVWGQRTMQREATAFDRLNVRRMFLILEKLISTVCQSLVFEPNDPIMWRRFKGLVTPLLQSVQNRRGITQFAVIADESTNTPDVIENNMFIGKIFIQPTKTAEILVLDFCATAQGTSFSESVSALGA